MTGQTLSIKELQKGFTLIELLVVIGILAILLAITLIAINPAKQFAQANDTKRRSDVSAMLNAIGQYSADNAGQLPGDGIGPGGTDIINSSTKVISTTGANICAFLIPKYLAAIPTDPTSTAAGSPITSCAGNYDTGYSVTKSSTDNRLIVSATGQMTPNIYVTR